MDDTELKKQIDDLKVLLYFFVEEYGYMNNDKRLLKKLRPMSEQDYLDILKRDEEKNKIKEVSLPAALFAAGLGWGIGMQEAPLIIATQTS